MSFPNKQDFGQAVTARLELAKSSTPELVPICLGDPVGVDLEGFIPVHFL